MEIQSFYVFHLRPCAVQWHQFTSKAVSASTVQVFSRIFININVWGAIANSLVCVPVVQLYQIDLEVSRARCNDPYYYSFICPGGSWVLPFAAQKIQHWSNGCQDFTSRARCIGYTLFPFRLTLGWNRSGSLQRKIYIQESWISMFPAADNQQARGDRSRKELADVGPGSYCSFSLALQCQMASPILLAAFLVYHSRHCLAVQEGGRQNCQG